MNFTLSPCYSSNQLGTVPNSVILALDVEPGNAKEIAKKFFPYVKIIKIGSWLFTASGPEIVRWLSARRKKVLLDLKFHDIPNTVAEAVRNAVKMKVWGLTVHTLGGFAMMKCAVKTAREEAKKKGIPKPLIFGVTLLTSLDEEELKRVGILGSLPHPNPLPQGERTKVRVNQLVVKLALLAKEAGLDGVVASGKEIQTIRKACGKNFLIAVPGIRLEEKAQQDQKRTATPQKAVQLGANYLIVGRPILEAKDPVGVIKKISEVVG